MKRTIFFILFSFFVTASLASAAGISLEPINTNIPGDGATGGPVGLIRNFYQYALLSAGVLAFAVIVWAGIRYTISGGSGGAQSDAKDQIVQALFGLLLLLGVYVILYTINPNLVRLTIPGMQKIGLIDSPKPTGVNAPRQIKCGENNSFGVCDNPAQVCTRPQFASPWQCMTPVSQGSYASRICCSNSAQPGKYYYTRLEVPPDYQCSIFVQKVPIVINTAVVDGMMICPQAYQRDPSCVNGKLPFPSQCYESTLCPARPAGTVCTRL